MAVVYICIYVVQMLVEVLVLVDVFVPVDVLADISFAVALTMPQLAGWPLVPNHWRKRAPNWNEGQFGHMALK
jgi:hypothetical protein